MNWLSAMRQPVPPAGSALVQVVDPWGAKRMPVTALRSLTKLPAASLSGNLTGIVRPIAQGMLLLSGLTRSLSHGGVTHTIMWLIL
jgi:hypothetical protein